MSLLLVRCFRCVLLGIALQVLIAGKTYGAYHIGVNKLFTSGSLGTGANAEIDFTYLKGTRLGLAYDRVLSQNDTYYFTDQYLNVYFKAFFESALHRYGVNPFASLSLGGYQINAEALDSTAIEDKTFNWAVISANLGVHYQAFKKLSFQASMSFHSRQEVLNTFKIGAFYTL